MATLATAWSVACAGNDLRTPSDRPQETRETPVVSRIVALENAVVAFDRQRQCRLEMAADPAPPGAQWIALDPDAVVARRFRVLARDVQRGTADAAVVALRVEDDLGNRLWLRNAPAANDAQLAIAWRCIVDASVWEQQRPKLAAESVELRLATATCPYLTPLLGSAADASLLPYRVTGFGLFAGATPDAAALARGETGVHVGVRLATNDDRHRLTVSTQDFDRCFAATTAGRTTADAIALAAWRPEISASPPSVDAETAEEVLGVDLVRCAGQGVVTSGCAVPLQRFDNLPWSSSFGGAVIVPVRERVVEAWRTRDDGSSKPAVGMRVAIQLSGTRDRSFGAALTRALEASRDRWSTLGFELVGAKRTDATHRVKLDVAGLSTSAVERSDSSVAARRTSAETIAAQLVLEQSQIDLMAARLEEHYAGLFGAGPSEYASIRAHAVSDGESKVNRLRRGDRTTAEQALARNIAPTRMHGGVPLLQIGHKAAAELTLDVVVAAPSDDTTAQALVEAIGEALAASITAEASGDVPSPKSALDSSAQVAGVRAASGRSIREIARLGDARGLSTPPRTMLPVRLPADSAQRCFTFVAVARSGTLSLLELGTVVPGSEQFVALARDSRGERSAGFDLCALAPGDYVVHTIADDVAAVRVFDSTHHAEPASTTIGSATRIESRSPDRPPTATIQRSDTAPAVPPAESSADIRCEQTCLGLDDGSTGALAEIQKCQSACEAR